MDNLIIKDFNGKKIYTFVWNNKPCWIASQIVSSCGYADSSTTIEQCIEKEEFEIGIEYEILTKYALKKFKDMVSEVTKATLVDSEIINKHVSNLIIFYEDGLYGFLQYTDKPIGIKFRKWLRRELIPEIIHAGEYKIYSVKEKIIKMNDNIELTLPNFSEKNVNPKYILLIWKHLYELAGLELPFLQDFFLDKELYEAQQIAQKLGIYSNGNKPHSQAIKAILDKIGIEEYEKQNVPFIINGHIDTTIKYVETVLPKIEKWIINNNYPSVISSGKHNLNVIYSKKKDDKKKKENIIDQVSFIEY